MNPKHQLIPLESMNAWSDSLQGIEHGFAHTWEYCRALHLTTRRKSFLYSFENESSRIVCPVDERSFLGGVDIVKPMGYSGFTGIGSCRDFPVYWREFVQNRGYVCGYLALHPYFKLNVQFDFSEVFHNYDVHILDLKPSLGDILSKMAKRKRQEINKFDKSCHDIIFDKFRIKKFFIARFNEFLRRKGAPPFCLLSDQTLAYLFDSDHVICIAVRKSGNIVAATMFTYTSSMGEALYHVSLPEGQKYSAGLIWQGAKALKNKAVPALILGGAPTPGIGKFKKRFGCEYYPLHSLRQIYRPNLYNRLCDQANVDVMNKSHFFPAYLKSGI
jgi:hypothetical protein